MDSNYSTAYVYGQDGQRTRIDYGNGTFTEYSYDPARRWLDTIKTQNKWGQGFQNISYSFDKVGNVLGYENDCLDNASGNYKTKQTYSYDNLYQLIKVNGATTYNPYQSSVPEFVSDYSQAFEFDADGLGNMTSKVSTETVSPQKSIGDNLNYSFDYVYDENFAHRLIRAGDRYYQYDANGNITCEQDGSFDGADEPVTYHKITKEADDVYSTDYGWGLFKDEDKSGGTPNARYRRTYIWDEKNRLISSVDSSYSTAYIYGQDGQRSNKYTQNSETLYFNKMWTLHTDSGNNVYGGQSAKNIYLGETRIVTKLNSGSNPTYQEEYYKQYYYHSDHLGSASLVSDYKGDEYQRIEYTPYGETWVEKTSNTGLEFLPYKFTAKELDKETGLYYYGARYLDPRYSRWISTDPALGEYIPGIGKGTAENFGSLPGMGGVYNCVNGNLYHYASNNPVRYIDPDGRDVILLNRSWGAYWQGHNACLVGDDTNGWKFYSKDGLHENSNINFATLNDFIDYNNSMKLDNKLSYDNAYRVETSREYDLQAQAVGDQIYNRGYSLNEKTTKDGSIKQNCADLAADIIGTNPNIEIGKHHIFGIFTKPNKQFSNFMNDNAGQKVDIFDKDKAEIRRKKYHPTHFESEYGWMFQEKCHDEDF